ncbi:MAG: FIST N-terminal domain-containing protein [Gaiellaceae bacterium]
MEQRTQTTKIGAGLANGADAAGAGIEAGREALAGVGARVDLAFCFVSADHGDEAEAVAAAVRGELEPMHLLGCVAQGVVARDRELQEGPGVAVWAASLPGAEVVPFHARGIHTGGGIGIAGFPELDQPDLVALLVDPYTFPASGFLERLNGDLPGLPLVGGIAAGGGGPGTQALLLDGEVHREGAVGVAVSGVPVATVVSQGCAPIGREAVITRSEGNVVHELAGQPALSWVRAQLEALPPRQQLLAVRGLLAGIVIDENKAEYGRGDFLMRGLLGVDEEEGTIAVGDQVRVGQTLRLHVRDAASAGEDLHAALEHAAGAGRPAGALLFTCNGRGTHMFPEPDHDARAVAATLGTPATAGFFCGGEIGPVGGRAFLHGFTATLAVFFED